MFHPFNSNNPSKLISVSIKCQQNDEMQHHGFGYLSYEEDFKFRFDGPCIMEKGI
jgi:hypothetical protein